MGLWYPLFAAVHWLAVGALVFVLLFWLGLIWLERHWADIPPHLRLMREQAPVSTVWVGLAAVGSTVWLVSFFGSWW